MDSNIIKKSKELEKLGNDLTKIQYDFKIKNTSSKNYWFKRKEEFENYHKKALEYFFQAYSLMNALDKEQSGFFLLRLSKLKQLGVKLIENMEKIKENPSIMDVKDKQQSKWSIELRDQLINLNKDCLNQEKKMNILFREFYEKNKSSLIQF